MDGKQHEQAAFILGFILTLFLLYKQIPLEITVRIVFGLTILSLWFSCDLDSPKSRPIQRWGPLKVIWLPFVNAGHREILHSKLWASPILCFLPSIPILLNVYATRDFVNLWILVGLSTATGLHIFCDWLDSIRNELKPKNILKRLHKNKKSNKLFQRG